MGDWFEAEDDVWYNTMWYDIKWVNGVKLVKLRSYGNKSEKYRKYSNY